MRFHRRLRVEDLESRALLAADATASVVGGNLIIRGSNSADDIAVSAGTNAGEVVVEGLTGGQTGTGGASGSAAIAAGNKGSNGGAGAATNTTPTAGTTAAAATGTTFTGVTGNVIVMLGGGDDSFAASDLDIGGNLVVMGGGGNDSIQIGASAATSTSTSTTTPTGTSATGGTATASGPDVSVGGNLTVRTGAGDDVISVTADVQGSANVDAGSGDNIVDLDGLTGANVRVRTSNGDDIVQIAGLTSDSLSVSTGAGDDVLDLGAASASATTSVDVSGNISVDAGAGDDTVSVKALTTTSLAVNTKQGDDVVSLDAGLAADLGAALKVNTGPGDDLVQGAVPENLIDRVGTVGNQALQDLSDRLSRLENVFSNLGHLIDDLPLDNLLQNNALRGLNNPGNAAPSLNLGRLNGLVHSLGSGPLSAGQPTSDTLNGLDLSSLARGLNDSPQAMSLAPLNASQLNGLTNPLTPVPFIGTQSIGDVLNSMELPSLATSSLPGSTGPA